jgi:hypothetical protein
LGSGSPLGCRRRRYPLQVLNRWGCPSDRQAREALKTHSLSKEAREGPRKDLRSSLGRVFRWSRNSGLKGLL